MKIETIVKLIQPTKTLFGFTYGYEKAHIEVSAEIREGQMTYNHSKRFSDITAIDYYENEARREITKFYDTENNTTK